MDIKKMLAELKAEHEGVEQAILVLERLPTHRVAAKSVAL
jgi:hypothetical protein